MRKLILVIPILALVLLASPNQTDAAWWNPLSWFANKEQVQEQKSDEQKPKEEISITPVPQVQTDNSRIIEDLKAEVIALRANLDNLYIAHNNLVSDYNTLLKYTNALAASNKSVGATTDSSNLGTRVTNLEEKLNDVCAQIFTSFGGLAKDKCPSPRFLINETLEYRIKKLEGGY